MKAGFTNKSALLPERNRNWVLAGTVVYRDGAGREIEVPKGFLTDLASVPRLLWWWFPPYGSYTFAAVLHDWLYRTGIVSRAVADATFLEAMESLGTGGFTRRILYLAVRIFGWSSYRNKKRHIKHADSLHR